MFGSSSPYNDTNSTPSTYQKRAAQKILLSGGRSQNVMLVLPPQAPTGVTPLFPRLKTNQNTHVEPYDLLIAVPVDHRANFDKMTGSNSRFITAKSNALDKMNKTKIPAIHILNGLEDPIGYLKKCSYIGPNQVNRVDQTATAYTGGTGSVLNTWNRPVRMNELAFIGLPLDQDGTPYNNGPDASNPLYKPVLIPYRPSEPSVSSIMNQSDEDDAIDRFVKYAKENDVKLSDARKELNGTGSIAADQLDSARRAAAKINDQKLVVRFLSDAQPGEWVQISQRQF